MDQQSNNFSGEIRIALLEQSQKNTDSVIARIVDLATTTKDLLVQQTARIDRHNEVMMEHNKDFETHRMDDLQFHTNITNQLTEALKEQYKCFKETREEFLDVITKLTNRISKLEKYWYLVTGGAFIVGALIRYIVEYMVEFKTIH